MTERFRRSTRAALRKAGWHPGRKIDLAPWRQWLDQFAPEAVEAARPLLEEFGGLVVWTFSEIRFLKYIPLLRWFRGKDPLRIEATDVGRDELRPFEKVMGPLCPFAWHQEALFLYAYVMRTDEKVYLADTSMSSMHPIGEPIYYVAENGDRALEEIIHGLWAEQRDRVVGRVPWRDVYYPEDDSGRRRKGDITDIDGIGGK